MDTRHRKHPHIKKYNLKGCTFWRVTFQLKGHQVRTQGFASFAEAETYYHGVRSEIRSGTWINSKTNSLSSMDMNELYALYCRRVGQHRSANTIFNGTRNWRNHIGKALGSKKPSAISRRTLALFVDKLRDSGLSDNSIKTVKAEVNNVLNIACEYELIVSVPKWPKLVPRVKKKTIMKPEDVNYLLSGFKNPQYKAMALVQYQLALRCGELLGLRPAAFDLVNRTVMIDRQVNRITRGDKWPNCLSPTKNRISRKLPISAELVEIVRPYVEFRNPEAPLWISDTLGPVRETSYNLALKRAAEAVGFVEKISSHCLRASMLDFLVNHSGLNIHAVAYFGRHSAKVLVSAYSKPDLEQLFAIFGGERAPGAAVTCDLIAIEDEELV